MIERRRRREIEREANWPTRRQSEENSSLAVLKIISYVITEVTQKSFSRVSI